MSQSANNDDEGECMPTPTTEESGNIKAIGADSVHKICSGQVVLSLAVAVKELVENSIDAGATLVEVRLRNQGLEALEVSDNGSGVREHDLEAMTAKYHTSKIKEFVDLQGIETFGFRGEALSSLCALSDMTIVTRHRDAEVGIKIELDHDGKVHKRTHFARSVGTTVTITNLFETLPVRRRDFTRNIKREFAKMCQMLQAYCLVAKGVRLICSNQTPKGGKTVIMQTHGATDVLANISAVFGSKQSTDLVSLRRDACNKEANESLIEELRSCADETVQISSDEIQQLNVAGQYTLEGFISSCAHGAGRASKDRQFYYVNNRPCDAKNLSKVVNEIYHRYNGQQFPFVYLNVLTARSDVDVNLAPDKRQLLIHNEKILLLLLRKTLLDAFGSTPATYTMQNTTIKSMWQNQTKEEDDTKEEVHETSKKIDANQTLDDELIPISTTQKFAAVLSQWKRTGDTKGAAGNMPAKRKCKEKIAGHTEKLQKIHAFLSSQQLEEDLEQQQSQYSYKSEPESDVEEVETDETILVERIDCKVVSPLLKASATPSLIIESKTDSAAAVTLDDSASDIEVDSLGLSCAEICTSLQEIELHLRAEEQHVCAQRSRARLERLRFKSEISPSQNVNAEAELQKELSKSQFAEMQVLGQFNLGFIVVKLDTDLFIVDQHASDEKYNFEELQRTTTLQQQPLAVPQPLELTAVNEMVLLSHLPTFEKSGFKFAIDEEAPATKKVRLLGRPYSSNWEFGKDDIDELIFMLQDAADGDVCRPSRVRAMFASRACRKSVMIGTALSKSTMRTLIRHMGEIEQPWNCPHGRPTMRHLINTSMLLDEQDDVA